jgi:hypothetical protein
VTITSTNEYATIELVSMDGINIDHSKKILLQVGTIFRPTNWSEEATTIANKNQQLTGFKITNTGKMPWLGMPVNGSITVKNKLIKKAIQLDAAGQVIKKLDIQTTGDGVALKLPADAYYILLED